MATASHIRNALRKATDPIHQRLHAHKGLSSVADGTINRADYEMLLLRLYGFHKPFDGSFDHMDRILHKELELAERRRASSIVADLSALGCPSSVIESVEICGAVDIPRDIPRFLGALYVVEGSTLGGLQLARALDPLLGNRREGRQFFLGYGARHGHMWQQFLRILDEYACDPSAQEPIIAGALETFSIFEQWMSGGRAADVHAGTSDTASVA
jgi:heme oxygenase